MKTFEKRKKNSKKLEPHSFLFTKANVKKKNNATQNKYEYCTSILKQVCHPKSQIKLVLDNQFKIKK
jgi:hypothetical protein